MAPLAEQLAALQHAFDGVAQPVLVIATGNKVVYANEAVGLWAEQGKDLDVGSPLGRALLPAIERAEQTRIEWGESTPGGVRCWYSCTVSPLNSEGQIAGWLCISADVTELKRVEERLRRSEQLMHSVQSANRLRPALAQRRADGARLSPPCARRRQIVAPSEPRRAAS